MVPGIIRSRNGCIEAVAEEYPPGDNLDKAKEFAAKFAIDRAFSSYDELLDAPKVQAVYVAQPNHLHATWTIQAAKKGKHVYCEKTSGLQRRRS